MHNSDSPFNTETFRCGVKRSFESTGCFPKIDSSGSKSFEIYCSKKSKGQGSFSIAPPAKTIKVEDQEKRAVELLALSDFGSDDSDCEDSCD